MSGRQSTMACRAILLPSLVFVTITAVEAGTALLPIDSERSDVTFRISRSDEVIEGTAPALSGEVRVDLHDPGEEAEVTLRIEPLAMQTGNRLRDRKMRSKHLEVEKFSDIVFRSTSIEFGGEKKPVGGERRRALVEGNLHLHGIERSILFPVNIRYDSGLLEVEGEVSFQLTDHAIPIPRFLWLVLDDEVTVTFHIVAGEREEPDGTQQGQAE